ncbi:TfpX/TfpZ family type IV pilin accessory protein [Acinetobacter radioresistens]|uniref:TfpX/TfpZ family type IV pilin accessory protein n=1 Tax=Acinetobacter radioresistens TaxID=40216 RepID=UPI000D0B5919|nr:TfpX/TfpZ family type IV pilin accessory protein [Acinetobacter radioresistens]MCX0339017.1 type IV pilin accessory protein [Acinetobacter radioresistens]PSD36838.1 type IV pilin accessory protein [Acinetobacter radioresistens]PSD39405.1 type IV pilin accessory protein [Acinetobacter radioresistens]
MPKFLVYHIFSSLGIALLLIILIFFIWYPEPLTQAVGVTHIFLILLAIDIIMGPVLGFIVYKEGKKTLKMDLSIVILLQALALGYGVYSIFKGRPAWLVYNVDRFEVVRNNEIITDHIEQAQPKYQQPSWLKPQFVAVEFARDSQIRQKEMFAEVLAGISIAQRPERYVSFSQAKTQLQQHAQSLSTLKQLNDPARVDQLLKQYPEATAWVPLKANAVDMVVLLNKKKAEVIKIVDLRPWK